MLFVCTQFIYQTVLFDSLIGPGQSGTENDGNEGKLNILQSSNITGASPSDCLMSYPGHWLRGLYTSAEMQLVYSTASAD